MTLVLLVRLPSVVPVPMVSVVVRCLAAVLPPPLRPFALRRQRRLRWKPLLKSCCSSRCGSRGGVPRPTEVAIIAEAAKMAGAVM
jgi:hypothetical protein